MFSFYNRFEDEEVLAIKEFSLERGMHVACQYLSKRTGKTEWCRGTVIVKLNLGNFKIDMFDHGVLLLFTLECSENYLSPLENYQNKPSMQN